MSDPVTYSATLPLWRASVEVVAAHLAARRGQVGTRAGRRALGCFDQAVLALRWMLDATRVAQLAVDNVLMRPGSHRGSSVGSSTSSGSLLVAAWWCVPGFSGSSQLRV